VIALLGEIVASFQAFLNIKEVVETVKSAASDYQEYLEKNIFPLMKDTEEISEINKGLSQGLERLMKSL